MKAESESQRKEIKGPYEDLLIYHLKGQVKEKEELALGAHFFIHSPWEDVDADDGKTEIILDPGVVFGTGLHPTTEDCLKAMAHLHGQSSLGRVLDLGTGTGILALAAARLGAEKVLAVDLNPLSIKTAQRNVRLNGLEESI